MSAFWQGEKLPAIRFDGMQLPDYAIILDLAADASLFPALSEQTSIWFWRFTICVGVNRSEHAAVILEHSLHLQNILRSGGEQLLPKLRHAYPDTEPREILENLQACLEILITRAQHGHECHWVAE